MPLEQAFARHDEHVIVMKAVDSYRVRRTGSRRGGHNQYSEPLVGRSCRGVIVVQCRTAASPLGTARAAWPAGPLVPFSLERFV